MPDALSLAVNGLYAAVSRASQSANNIVNASSTGNNLDASLINLKVADTQFAANATVIKNEEKLHKALLDIKV